MIQIRLSADSMEELAAAKKRMQGMFTVYRLKEPGEPKGGRYKAYYLVSIDNSKQKKIVEKSGIYYNKIIKQRKSTL